MLKNRAFLVTGLILLEITVGLIFLSPQYAVNQSVLEARWITGFIGQDAAEKLQVRADNTYQLLIVDSGLQSALRLITPDEKARARSKGLENLGAPVWQFAETRIEALLDLFYWAIRRLHLLLMWLPAVFPALLAAAASGLLSRRIKQTNFALTSAVLQHYTWRVCGWSTAAFLLAFFAPVAVPPVVVPVIVFALAVAFGLSLANIAKRL